jgi:hypothetical protein
LINTNRTLAPLKIKFKKSLLFAEASWAIGQASYWLRGFHWSSHHHAANEKYGEILPNEPKVSPGLFGHVPKSFVTI